MQSFKRLHGEAALATTNVRAAEPSGLEFGIGLLLTLCLGVLATVLAADDDNLLHEYLIEVLYWAATLLAVVGIFYAAVTPGRWTARVVVIFVVFSLAGASSRLVGAHLPDVAEFRRASNEWSTHLNQRIERLAELTKSLDAARADYDDCARQRDALRLQTELAGSKSIPSESSGAEKRLDGFCNYERLHFEAVSNFRNAADADLEIVTSKRPTYRGN